MSEGIRNRLWINNEWEDAAGGGSLVDINPATGEVITEVAAAEAADVDRAVTSAQGALASSDWGRMNPHKRAELLWRLSDLILENADELAQLETADNGKPIFESRQVDLNSVVENYRYFAGMADKIGGGNHPGGWPLSQLHT